MFQESIMFLWNILAILILSFYAIIISHEVTLEYFCFVDVHD
jgi:hypothetical protein